MNIDTKIHPLSESSGDYDKMKPLVGAWGTPSNPFATVQYDLESMTFGLKYFFIGLISSVYRGEKTWTKSWGAKKVTSGMARGKALIFGGRDEKGAIILSRMSWISFFQLKPTKRAAW